MTGPYWSDDTVTLYVGDCREVLVGMPDASVDAVVTDPPYGLEFMGAEWDTFKPGGKQPLIGASDGTPFRRHTGTPSWAASGNPVCRNCGGTKYDRTRPNGCSCARPNFPNEAAAHMRAFQSWCEPWAAECLRVLKPGAHLLAFGGTRTYHRLAAAIEDVGFEIRDSLHWIYGSGFSKGISVAKAMERAFGDGAAWEGWNTTLKPAHEPIILARKPPAGTIAANVTRYGVGAINIAACRIAPTGESRPRVGEASQETRYTDRGGTNFAPLPGVRGGAPEGRWPTNLVFSHSALCVDEGACEPDCPVAELDRQSGVRRAGGDIRDTEVSQPGGGATYSGIWGRHNVTKRRDDGGASRFFPTFRYEAKAGSAERPKLDDGTAHATVKPLSLMRWLVRLVTPPGGVVLDPFAGSGTTGEACVLEGFRAVLIELEPPHAELIRRRLSKPLQPSLDLFAVPTRDEEETRGNA
ncbi:DNA-methyltransferase [Nonomuraea sp. NPDC004702]